MNFNKFLKYIGILILLVLFLIQVFIFVVFELVAPGFMDGESSHWYNSVFLISIPANLYMLYWVSKR
jgi:hypothetical protein